MALQLAFVIGEAKVVVLVRVNVRDLYLAFVLESQPGKQVGVVLFIGEQDGVPRLEFVPERHDVDGVAGVLGEDDFFFRSGVDKLLDYPAGALDAFLFVSFYAVVNFLREPVPTPGAAAAGKAVVVVVYGLNDLPRDQCRAGVIEVDGGLAVAPVLQRWEVRADFLDPSFAVHCFQYMILTKVIQPAPCPFSTRYSRADCPPSSMKTCPVI